MRRCILFIVLLILANLSFSQTSSVLPSNRMVDWQNAGIADTSAARQEFSHQLLVTDFGAAGDGRTDDTEAVMQALEKAKNLEGRVEIHFPAGEYLLTRTINIYGQSNVSLTGVGPDIGPGASAEGTLLIFDDSLGDFVNDSDNFTSLIRVSGWISSEIGTLRSFDEQRNAIAVNGDTGRLKEGQVLLIRPTELKDGKFLGLMTNIRRVNEGELVLADNFTLNWIDRGDVEFNIILINAVSNVSIENMSILRRGTYKHDHNETAGVSIHFRYATESAVRNVNSFNPVSIHINTQFSSRLDIMDNFFDGAQNTDGYGGGQGYGTDISSYSTNVLVENNIFRRLRHAMVVGRGANRNVFGYNYSREVIFTSGANIADLSIHGHYPYANLFEGNYVDHIWADDYHSANGPLNTLLRNYVEFNEIVIESSRNMNIVGNAGIITRSRDSEGVIDNLGTSKTIEGNKVTVQQLTHDGFTEVTTSNNTLPDVSYYKTDKPLFFDDDITWPPLGPRVRESFELSQTIPAKERFCKAYPQECMD